MRRWYLSLCMGGVWSAGWSKTPTSRPDATHIEWQIPVSHRYSNKYTKQNFAPSWIYLEDCPIFLPDFNKIWIPSTDFHKSPKYQISWKPVRWEARWYVWVDGRSDMMKVIDAFRYYANAPQNYNGMTCIAAQRKRVAVQNVHPVHTWRYRTQVRRTADASETFALFNPLSPELNPICYLLALLGAHHFLHVSRIRVRLLTFRILMSYIYGAPILDVSRSHTTTQHSR